MAETGRTGAKEKDGCDRKDVQTWPRHNMSQSNPKPQLFASASLFLPVSFSVGVSVVLSLGISPMFDAAFISGSLPARLLLTASFGERIFRKNGQLIAVVSNLPHTYRGTLSPLPNSVLFPLVLSLVLSRACLKPSSPSEEPNEARCGPTSRAGQMCAPVP